MTITAFLEAAKKASGGEWQHEAASGLVASVLNYHEDEGYEWAKVAEFENPEDAELAVAARNAAKEIEELVYLCRKITDRGKTVSTEDVDRIREIVK